MDWHKICIYITTNTYKYVFETKTKSNLVIGFQGFKTSVRKAVTLGNIFCVKMTITLKAFVCLVWYAYQVNTEFFLPSNDAILTETWSVAQAANEIMCTRSCKSTEGCYSFSFEKITGKCTLARNSTDGAGTTELFYTRRVRAIIQ